MSSSEIINIITKHGFTVCTPKNICLMTPYIVLEQEAWFEDEVNILPELIAPNCSALDIGANHGVYTLAIANYIKQSQFGGRVHAFEPNKALHPLIMASVRENNLLDYVSLREEGLSNRAGHATFYIPENPELASLDYFEGAREVTVPVTTLNDLKISLSEGERIGLIKLDAEGAELDILAGGKDFFDEHQPIIMFEVKHGSIVNLDLIKEFIDMGYSVFKTLGELGLLVPFDHTQPLDGYQLNLIACSPRETQRLMTAGIVLQEVFDVSSPKELYSDFSTPSFGLLVDENDLNDTLRNAVMHVKASLNPSLEAGVRWSHACFAIHNLLSLDDDSKRIDVDFALARLYSMVGQRQDAVKTLQRLLVDINGFGLSEIRWRVSCHPNFDQQPVNDDVFGWQRCSAYEAWIHLSSFSGYFNNNQTGLLKKIYNEPHHSIEMERRLALMLLRRGAKISIGSESKLCTDAHLNANIWKDMRTNAFLFKDQVIGSKQLSNNTTVVAKAAAADVDGRFREIIMDPINILIERVPEAGTVRNGCVVLHNGNDVPLSGKGSYYGDFSKILIYNRGVHEPLEEYLFQEMLHTLPAAPTMLELGAYWAHYSMWLKKARPNSQVWMVEPDTTSIEAGRANFQRNGYKGTFIQDFVGNGHFQVDTFLGDFGAQNLDILHCDIQGFEIEMLKGAHHSLETNKINHLFISTHSQEIHMEICRVLTSYNYGIEIDSDFSFDSTSYDGLVVASRPGLTLFEEGNFIGRNKILGASPKLLLDTLSKLYNVRSLVN